jgi:hypothetical protein
VKIQPSIVACCQSPVVRRTVIVAPGCNVPRRTPFAAAKKGVSA